MPVNYLDKIGSVVLAAIFFTSLGVSANPASTLFSSVKSGGFIDSSTWITTQGSDEDGIPDANDSVLINDPHSVEYQGTASQAVTPTQSLDESLPEN